MGRENKDTLQGEGNYDAAERYTQEKRKFVESGKVKEAAEKASKQSAAAGKKAREQARSRAKEHDPRETTDFDEAS